MSVSDSILKILKLREVPNHSTICRMMGIISKQLLQWILRKALKEKGWAEEIIAIDGTDFREEQASVCIIRDGEGENTGAGVRWCMQYGHGVN